MTNPYCSSVYYPIDRLTAIQCDLPAGHVGDHHALICDDYTWSEDD